jgi:DNA-binding NtrC family response regulator
MSAACATKSATPARAPSTRSAMADSPALTLAAAHSGAAFDAPAGSCPAPRAVGAHSLRELVEQAVADAEARAIRRALVSAKGNKSLAARILQTNYNTLHAKMKRFEISAQEFRAS